LLLSYEKIKHIVEVDEKILAVFTINSEGRTLDIFIAPDAKIDEYFIEILRSKLDIKFEAIDKATAAAVEERAKEKSRTQMIGKHLWDISEYDKIRVIKIYETNRLIVVLAKSHTPPGNTADAVLGYLYECNEDELEQQEEGPPCLF
jgi:predicted transglutaminase-like protease